MKVVITGNSATLHGPFPISFVATISLLSGKKDWRSSTVIVFEALPNNLKRLQNCGHEIEFVDESGVLADLADFENQPTQVGQIPVVQTNYKPKLPLREYQQNAVNLSAERKAYAYLLEIGLGKSAIAITNFGMLCLANKVTGVLIVAPLGVHSQWVNEQIPEHLDSNIIYDAQIWKGTIPKFKQNVQLQILSLNTDAMRTKSGFKAASDFLKAHDGKSIMLIDESQSIKTLSAQRTKAALQLGSMATYRRILSGTPISKHVGDLFSQFKFLDERILGHKYFTSFRSHFLIMGGWEGKQIVGQKNIEELYSLISRHSFRLTKSEALDLPPKIYVRRPYQMSEVTAQHYNSLKNNFLTMIDNGEIVDVQNAITALLRLQQILSGFLPREDGSFDTFSNERIEHMMEIIEQSEGQAIIWARFTQDLLRIKEALDKEHGKDSAVLYYGDNAKTRDESVALFSNKQARFFVANTAAGSAGLNLQKSGCQTVIYYSNNYNYVQREQSEGRNHRMGTQGAVTYFDLCAEKSIDSKILKNLQSKKNIADLSLDEIRKSLI